MEFKWVVTTFGVWRLLEEIGGYTQPLALAFIQTKHGAPGQYVGTVFGQGKGVPDLDFDEGHTLEEIKALLETTVALRQG